MSQTALEDPPLKLGTLLRTKRERLGLPARLIAGKIGKTASYLSDIEADRRVPAEPVLRGLSEALDLDFDALMALAGRMSEDASQYLKRHPNTWRLLRGIVDNKLTDEELEALQRQVKKIVSSRSDR